MSTTADVGFLSKSNSVGSIRWDMSAANTVAALGHGEVGLKAQLIDGKFLNLPNRWFAISINQQLDQFVVRVFELGNEEVMPVEGEAAAELLKNATSLMDFTLSAPSQKEAIDSFERCVANVMHKRLEPTLTVQDFWVRLLETGTLQAPA